MKRLSMKRHKTTLVLLFLCLLFCVGFIALPGKFHAQGYDYLFHFEKTQGHTTTSFDDRPFFTYPSLFHAIAFRFVSDETLFYAFTLFLLGVVTPMLLFKLTGNPLSVLFYFSTTSYFYFMEQGVYAQALVGVLLLLMLNTKNPWHHLGLIFLGWASHNSGLIFLSIAMFFIHLPNITFWLKKQIVMLSCSGWFPVDRPNELLNQRILPGEIANGISQGGLRVSFFLKLFLEIFPVWFLVPAFFQLWKTKRNLFYFCLVILALGVFEYRIWFFIPLIGIVGLSEFYNNLSPQAKKYFLVFTVINGIGQLFLWYRYKDSCFPLPFYDGVTK
mgnify:FL=1